MSSPRLKALQDVYSKLEKAHEEMQQKPISESDSNIAINHSTPSNDASNGLNYVQKFSKQYSGVENIIDSCEMKENRIDDTEDPLIAAFYQQEAKKIKLENHLPIEDWAPLHFAGEQSQFENVSGVILTKSTIIRNVKDTTSDNDDDGKNFESVRKVIKEKLIEKLTRALKESQGKNS